MKAFPFHRVVVLVLMLLLPSQIAFGQVKPDERVQMNFHRAETAWRNRTSLLEAKVRADQVLRAAPDHANALKLRAEVLIAMERYEDALQDAERATTLDPNDGSAHLLLAEAARLAGNTALARGALERAASLAIEEGAEFHIRLSRIALLLGEEDWGMAESYARVALAKDRNSPAAYYQLARVFAKQDRIEDAITTLTRGFESDLLDAVYLKSDSTLSRLAGHDRLMEYMNE